MENGKPRSTKKSGRRVLVVDDHPIVRQGLAQLIDESGDLCVCGQVEHAGDVVPTIPQAKPEIVLIDLHLGEATGLDVIECLRTEHPKLPVLVLSMHDESVYAERAVAAGARGYVMKDAPVEELLGAIRRVLGGEIYLSEKMTRHVLQKMAVGTSAAAVSPVQALSNRELEVFELIGQGLGTREIAKRLHLSTKTIDTHRENIKRKLKVNNAIELHQHAFAWTQLGAR